MPIGSSTSSHAQAIKSRTRTYQLTGVLCLAAAGACLALPLSDFFGPPPAPEVKQPVEVVVEQAPEIEVSTAAGVLVKLTGYVKPTAAPAELPTTTASETPVEPVPDPAPSATEWAYLGSILGLKRPAALVRIDTTQHMLRPGEKLDDTELVDVSPTRITVRASTGATRTIELAARAQQVPSDPAKRPAMMRPGAPVQPGMMSAAPVRPGAQPPSAMAKPPDNFDAVRRAQQTTAAAARAAAAVQSPPPRLDPAKLEEMTRDIDSADLSVLFEDSGIKLTGDKSADRSALRRRGELFQKLSDESVDTETRLKAFRQNGLPLGTDPDVAYARLRAMGVDQPTRQLTDLVKINASGGK
jgi:hypothetical protein